MARQSRKRVEIFTYTTMDVLLASPINPTPIASRRHQLTRMWGGLASIESGSSPTNDDWRVCSDAVNLMETLITQGIVEDSRGLLADAITALAKAGTRAQEGHQLRLDGPGIQAVRALLEDYADLLEVLSHRTMVACHRATERRIREIMNGKVTPNDVVVMAL